MCFPKFVFAALCAALVVSLAGCGDKIDVVQSVTGPSPMPTPSPPEVTSVTVHTLNKKISLNNCDAQVEFSAIVQPASASQTIDRWEASGGTFTPSGNTARLRITALGFYTVTAFAQGKSGSETIEVTGGNCPTLGPPPPSDSPSVRLDADPPTIDRGGHSDLRIISSRVRSCTWTEGLHGTAPTGGRERVSPTRTTDYEITCLGDNGREVKDDARITVRDTSPPPSPPPPPLPPPVPQCRDGVDNDGDGKIDYPADPGCISPDDNDERDTVSPTCPTSGINYSLPGGTAYVNRNTSVSASTPSPWPSNCQIIWGTNKPSVIKVLGADAVYPVCDASGTNCPWFYAGKNAVITGVYPGIADITAQVISIGSDGKWRIVAGGSVSHSWTVVNPTSLEGLPESVAPPKYHDLDYVSQVLPE